VAISDEDWMLWNFYDTQHGDINISNQVPKFDEVHHVWVKRFSNNNYS
jgi:hypothetical protein